MKFGKKLRLLAKEEWASSYVDYKMFKLVLRHVKDDIKAGKAPKTPVAVAAEDPGHVDSTPVILPERKEGETAEKWISRLLSEEIKKVIKFFDEHVEDCKKQLAEVEKKGPALVHADSASNLLDLQADPAQSSTWTSPRSQSMSRIADAMEAKEDQSFVSNTSNDGAPAPPMLPVIDDAVEFADLIQDLREYAELNATAVAKVVKKFRKRTGIDLEAFVDKCWGGRDLQRDKEVARLDEKATAAFRRQLRPSKPRRFLRDLVLEPSIPTVRRLDIKALPIGKKTFLYVSVGKDSLSQSIAVPVMVARGAKEGAVLGITSALHGNELNGIPVIHKLFKLIDCSKLCGTVVAVPVMNPHGYRNYRRTYVETDLNRIMPGKKNGSTSQAFAYYLIEKIVKQVQFLLDMHTASFGRVNSLYVRADMTEPSAYRLAMLQPLLRNPQIVVHNTGPDGSLRGAATALGIPAITVEIGNPQRFHSSFLRPALEGVLNVMSYLKMLPHHEILGASTPPTVCARSFWIFTKTGGVLYVFPAVNAWVRKGEIIAEIRSIFGELTDRYIAPCDGVIVGKSENPVAQTGDRILHLGVVEEIFPAKVSDGHE